MIKKHSCDVSFFHFTKQITVLCKKQSQNHDSVHDPFKLNKEMQGVNLIPAVGVPPMSQK